MFFHIFALLAIACLVAGSNPAHAIVYAVLAVGYAVMDRKPRE